MESLARHSPPDRRAEPRARVAIGEREGGEGRERGGGRRGSRVRWSREGGEGNGRACREGENAVEEGVRMKTQVLLNAVYIR